MTPTFEEIDCCIDYADSVGLYEVLCCPGSDMLVLVKPGVNFEIMIANYMKWLYATLNKRGTTKIRSWYAKYPKGKYFAVTPKMTPRMAGLIPEDDDTLWKVYFHTESGHLFAQFVSGTTPPNKAYFASDNSGHTITCALALS